MRRQVGQQITVTDYHILGVMTRVSYAYILVMPYISTNQHAMFSTHVLYKYPGLEF